MLQMAGHAAESFKDTISRTSRLFSRGFPGASPVDMRKHAAHIVDVESGVESKNISVTIGARDVAVSGIVPVGIWLPDFVASHATLALRAFKMQQGSGENQQGQCDASENPGEVRKP